jgi:hypothetical protein
MQVPKPKAKFFLMYPQQRSMFRERISMSFPFISLADQEKKRRSTKSESLPLSPPALVFSLLSSTNPQRRKKNEKIEQ